MTKPRTNNIVINGVVSRARFFADSESKRVYGATLRRRGNYVRRHVLYTYGVNMNSIHLNKDYGLHSNESVILFAGDYNE